MTTIPAESDVKISGVRSAKKALAKATGSLAGDIASALKTEPVTLPAPTGRQVVSVPLAAIIASPDNPREDVEEDVLGLAASMQSSGLLQPILVVPADLYRAGNSQIPDAADDGRFVVVAGHRRTFAARSLGWTHIDAIIEQTRVGLEARKAMIIENFQRVDLTPLEEAKAFAELQQLGMKQDDLAEQVGCSQSHISKRLGLLKLDTEVQAAVAAKELAIADALELGKLDETGRQVAALKSMRESKKQSYGIPVSASAAVGQQLRAKKLDEDKAKARESLRKAQIEEAQNLQSLFGNDYWSYVLTPDEVKKHKKAKLDCVVAHINEHQGDVRYYCKAKKRCAVYPARQEVTPARAREREDERGRKAAMKSRREAAAKLALFPLTTSELTDFLLEQYLEHTLPNDASVSELAMPWVKDGLGYGGLDYTHWRIVGSSSIKAHPDAAKILPRWAAAMRVAGLEQDISNKHRYWCMRHALYLRDLTLKAGYTATAWEIQRLTAQVRIANPEAFLTGADADLPPMPCENCKKPTPPDQLEDDWCKACIKAELDVTPEDEQ